MIKSNLKYANFEWMEEAQRLEITNENGTTTSIPRKYLLSLVRICLRVLSHYFVPGLNSLKKRALTKEE
jgi:hypothetical protein